MGFVHITEENGQLGGTLQTADGITGMVLTGGIDGGGYVLGTPITITSPADLATNGITADGNAFALRQVADFYTTGGDGAILYLLLVTNTITLADMADNTNPEGAKKLLDYAAGKIKVLGLMTDDTAVAVPGIANGLNSDVYAAATNIAVMAAAYFAAERPFRAVIAGTSYSGVAGDLTDETAGTTNNRTAILIGDTVSGKAACLGLLMGLVSSLPVQRKISRVRNGALPINAAFVGTVALGDPAANAFVIQSRGFITFTTYPNVSGIFFSGDPMLTATTDDYCLLARGRVIDKAHILAYTTFVAEVDDEIPVNTDGTLNAGFCKWLSQQIVNQINNTMVANKEISSVSCYINPAQNVLSTNTVAVVLKVTPVGYATDIEISLGFNNPAA